MSCDIAKYKKEFVFDRNTWGISNMEGLNKYLDEKIEELKKSYGSVFEKEVKKNIIKEFLEIYEYDCKNSIMPLGSFRTDEEKNKRILENDIVLVLGNIFLGMHSEIIHKKLPFPTYRLPNNVIDYNEVYYEGLNAYFIELLGIKKAEVIDIDKLVYGNMNEKDKLFKKTAYRHCIFATYSFLPLIEYMLCEKLATLMILKSSSELKRKTDSGEIFCDDDDLNYIKRFNFCLNTMKEYIYTDEDMENIYNIFVKYNVIEDNKENKEIITRYKWDKTNRRTKRVTLGDMISNKFFRENCEPEYLSILEYIFKTKYLNLRNSTLHGSSSSFDYFNITFTSILVQFFWDITSNSLFKEFNFNE